MNEQNWITVTINVSLIYSELKENVNLNICSVKENVNLKICEVNDGKNRACNVQKLQLGKNQTQCRHWRHDVQLCICKFASEKREAKWDRRLYLLIVGNPRIISNANSGSMCILIGLRRTALVSQAILKLHTMLPAVLTVDPSTRVTTLRALAAFGVRSTSCLAIASLQKL